MKNKNVKFTVSNFRVFEKTQNFELSPITLLIGPNNSGKSTLVKALNFFKVSETHEIVNFFLETKLDRRHSSSMKSLLANDQEPLEIVTELEVFTNKFFQVQMKYGANIGGLTYFKLGYQGEVLHTLEYREIEDGVANGEIEHVLKFNYLSFNFRVLRQLLADLVDDFSISEASRYTFKFLEEIQIDKSFYQDVFENKELNEKQKQDRVEELKKLMNEEFFVLRSTDEKLPVTANEMETLIQFQNELLSDNEYILDEHIKRENLQEQYGKFNTSDRDFKSDFEVDFQFWSECLRLILQFKMEQISSRLDVTFSPLTHIFNEGLIPWLVKNVRSAHQNASRVVEIPSVKSVKQKYFNLSSPDDSYLSEVVKELHFRDPVEPELSDLMYVQKWIKKFGIGQHISTKSINKDIYELYVTLRNGKEVNTADMGFGVSQIISLILTPLKYYTAVYSGEFKPKPKYRDSIPTFYLEEPESNLHPNWQSLLIELIVDMNKTFGMRFIIETHSEYMIRKLQNLSFDDESKETVQNTKVIYFRGTEDFENDPSNNKRKCYEIKIDENGMLSRPFGPGFYDEAGKLTLNLLGNNPLYKN